jgi:hypothetical protein
MKVGRLGLHSVRRSGRYSSMDDPICDVSIDLFQFLDNTNLSFKWLARPKFGMWWGWNFWASGITLNCSSIREHHSNC